MKKNDTARGWTQRMRAWFPEREFFMRSDGKVRFVTVSSRLQIGAAALIGAAVIGMTGSMGAMAYAQYEASAERAALMTRAAKVADSEERLATYRDDIDTVAEDLQRRQDFIEDMVAALPEDVKVSDLHTEDGKADGSDTAETQAMVGKVSAAIPEAATLARIEARQLAFVDGMTRFADARAERAEAALRELGLNPATVLRQAEREAMGGPLEKFVSASGGPIDPRFERLGLSLARMGALELTLDSVPQVMPASAVRMSSGFGFRRDPFTGGGAMHSGLDFAGPIGTPIQAAANGRVSFVGVKSGYGKVVEIDHGNGLITRYAHLSAFNVKRGAEIRSGERIAAMGSTGRSTGSHLHFEVRLNGRAVNPRTFLERAPDVLEKARSDAPRAQQ